MMTTLKRVVQDDRIQWKEDVESVLPKNRPTQVLVTILDATPSGLSPEERGKRRVAALRNLASGNAFSTIEILSSGKKRPELIANFLIGIDAADR